MRLNQIGKECFNNEKYVVADTKGNIIKDIKKYSNNEVASVYTSEIKDGVLKKEEHGSMIGVFIWL